MVTIARDIDRKLCLTAALLGAVSRKDLALAFHRANPATSFDVERAHKWLQGRARPRDQALYDDWAKVLGLELPGGWIADCDVEEFLDRLCAGGAQDRAALWRRAEAFGGVAPRAPEEPGPQRELAGLYVCYSHAWSPYFAGRLIRGVLEIKPAPNGQGALGTGTLGATYNEAFLTGRLVAAGAVSASRLAVHLDLRATDGAARFLCCLFPPTPPASVLAGFMCGVTVLGPEPRPSVTRIVMVRLPRADPCVLDADPYLAPGASVAADLARFGAALQAPCRADRKIAAFLAGNSLPGLDQLPPEDYHALVELFDREWISLARARA